MYDINRQKYKSSSHLISLSKFYNGDIFIGEGYWGLNLGHFTTGLHLQPYFFIFVTGSWLVAEAVLKLAIFLFQPPESLGL